MEKSSGVGVWRTGEGIDNFMLENWRRRMKDSKKFVPLRTIYADLEVKVDK